MKPQHADRRRLACSKADFARLLEVDAANVSRWAAAGRLDLDECGRVRIAPSLARLLESSPPPPARAGKSKEKATGRARRLLDQLFLKAQAEAGAFMRELAALREQIQAERMFREQRCITRDEAAQYLARVVDAMLAQWADLTAAIAAGGDAFERRMFRIECRVCNNMTDAEIEAEELEIFGA